ncbi:MAG: CHAT domain-containing tetratricopeptide repeat protein, partial [Balneola sp.]
TSVKTRLNIAFCYQKLEELDLARSLYNKILSEHIKKDNTFDAIEIYLRFAELEHETGNFTEALSYAKKASALSQGTESKQLKAKSYASLSKAHLALNNTDLALNYSKRAYQIASVFKGYRLASYTALLAKAFYQAQSDSAFYYADLAFAEIEREQSSVYGENLESGVFSNYADFYNEVAYWYLEQKKDDIYKAFEITERGRARVLLERLSFSESDLQNVVEDTTLIALRQKEKNIDKLYRQIENSKDELSVSKLKSELSELEFQYQSFTNELHLKYPKLRAFNELETIKIPEIQNSLSTEDALIEYMFTDHRLIIFRITKDEADYTSVEIDSGSPKNHLSGLVSDFRTAIQEKAALDLIGKRSQPLFDLLLKPLSNKLDGINNLLIVSSKSLSLLPFDALYINSSFLIEKFSIKYLPSSTIYKYIEPPHRTTSRELFAVAGSGLNGSTSQTKNYSSLPSTILEVDVISKEFIDVLTLKDQEVSESKIKSLPLNEFRYLHFATHGNVNELNPQQSGLIISELVESEGAFQEDGYLNSKEISSLTFNADLVVLSACNTAVGKIISGEGLHGLQRSFFKAGASSVVVSLWSVYDNSTASFMGSFYKNLSRLEKEEIGLWNKFKLFFDLYEPPMFGYKENALHMAKKELLDHPYYNHPVYWAPFIMIGK